MDFTMSQDQESLVTAIDNILTQQAGAERARELGRGAHDDDLMAVLADGGFLDMALDDAVAGLGAALVVERLARHAACINFGVRMLVAPAVLGADSPARLAVTRVDSTSPVRFGQFADLLLVLQSDDVVVARIDDAHPVASKFGFPYATLEWTELRRLGGERATLLRDWWRVALATEIVGALDGAVAHTVAYLRERTQFGRPLGSLQSLQHRLAEAHARVEGARWLARRAADTAADSAAAAMACAFAAQAAQSIAPEMHQMSGAIGFTEEFDLHVWTTRLQALRLELGGITEHQLATTDAVWGR